MLAFAYNFIAIFSVLDASFLHNTLLAIIIYQTIKHIDTLPLELWKFIKKNWILLVAIIVFITYAMISRFWYDFDEKFYFITITDLQQNIILTLLYGFLLIFYATKINITGITKHNKMLFAPIITIPIVFLIDFYTHFSIQKFIYIRKVGLDNLHIGMVYYTFICAFIFTTFAWKNKIKTTILSAVVSFSFLIILSTITKAGRITPMIFIIYLINFVSFLIYNYAVKYVISRYKIIPYFIFIVICLVIIIPLHLLSLNKNIFEIKNYTSRTIAHRQCIWNATYTMYKALPHKIIGHGLNSYKAVNIMDSKNENKLNCDRILSQMYYKNNEESNIENTKNKPNNANTKINRNNKITSNNNQKINTKNNNKNNISSKTTTNDNEINNDNKIEFSKINSIALHPHSIILQTLFEFGIIGIVLLNIIVLFSIYTIMNLKQTTKKQTIQKTSILSVFMMSFFAFLFSHSLYTFWLWDIIIISMFMHSAINNKKDE